MYPAGAKALPNALVMPAPANEVTPPVAIALRISSKSPPWARVLTPEPIAPAVAVVARAPGVANPSAPNAGPANAPPDKMPRPIGMAFIIKLSNFEPVSPTENSRPRRFPCASYMRAVGCLPERSMSKVYPPLRNWSRNAGSRALPCMVSMKVPPSLAFSYSYTASLIAPGLPPKFAIAFMAPTCDSPAPGPLKL